MRPGDLDDPTPVEPDDALLQRVHIRSGAFRRRRRTQRFLSVGAGALVIVLAVAVAVRVGEHDSVELAGPQSTTTTTQPALTFEAIGGEWQPTSISGYDGPLTRLAAPPRLTFAEGGKLTGSDGCNGFSASYALGSDGSLRVTDYVQTLIGCNASLPLQRTFDETARFDTSDGRLRLLSADGRELGTFVRVAVSARIQLPTDEMVAGSTMKGKVVVDNETGQVIKASGCGSLFAVALRNADYEPMFGWPSCLQNLDIPTGISTYPVEVLASRLAVGAAGPLEPGQYEATLYQSTHVVSDPAPIPIQVTAHAVPAVTARIELPSDTIVAGTTMKGTVVVQNDTGAAVHASGCLNYLQVLLESDAVQQAPGWRECLQQFTFPVGESSHPITVSASYNGCVGGTGTPGFVACAPDGGPPPLPVGDYRATLFQSDDVVPAPTAVPVQVVASP